MDQGLSSATNLLLGLLLARQVSNSEFGAYALAFASYTWVTSGVTSVAIEPLVVRYAAAAEHEQRQGTAMAWGVAAIAGVLAACVSMIVAVSFDDLRTAFAPLALIFPAIVLQDAVRLALFATGRGKTAFVNDAFRMALLAVLAGALIALNEVSVPSVLICWGIASGASATVTIMRTGVLPAPGALVRWWRLHSRLITRFAAEFLAVNTAAQITTFSIAVLVGVSAVGVLRAGEILLGPVVILFFAVTITGVPHAVGLLNSTTQQLSGFVSAVSLLLVFATVVWGGLLLLMPAVIGIAILGPLWLTVQPILVPLVFARTVAGLSSAGIIGLRAMGAAHRSLTARILASLLTVACGVSGALLGGLLAATWGMALAACLGTVLWHLQFRAALRERRALVSEGSAPS